MTGVEIGPLANPIVSRDDGRIIYVDHQNAEGLRQKYANNPDVAVMDIVDVDAIWGSNTLQEAIGPGVAVDYVVASHVVEHVPDLISPGSRSCARSYDRAEPFASPYRTGDTHSTTCEGRVPRSRSSAPIVFEHVSHCRTLSLTPW